MADVQVRPFRAGDPAVLAEAFAAIGWPGKTVARYRGYLDEQAGGARACWVAEAGGEFAGYLTVVWTSSYRPFAEAGIPEIQDLNVLPHLRRRGLASVLMDAAEELIADRCGTAGLGVGLTADYAPAHRLYLARGYLPDGRGIAYRGAPVAFGETVTLDDDLALMMTRALRG